jgi:hypothetical protein
MKVPIKCCRAWVVGKRKGFPEPETATWLEDVVLDRLFLPLIGKAQGGKPALVWIHFLF